ncbi:MAG TPA: sortase [Ruminococcaceae bacterium]|nr:sortase [Oscillospiraceae bacterium]
MKKTNIGNFFLTLGVVLLLACVAFIGYNIYQTENANEVSAQIASEIKITVPNAEKAEYNHPKTEMPEKQVDGTSYIALLDIPKLKLTLPVASTWSKAQLKKTPCCYSGSLYADNFVIAGHNYRSHFKHISKLVNGDSVRLTDMNGTVFEYEVDAVDVLEPTAIEEMTAGNWPLTLFTCNPSGTYRIAVRCRAAE